LILACVRCGAGTKPTGWKPALLGPFFARGVFRVEEKAETFTKGVKRVAPENSIHPQGLVRALE
jgi:hypothetical protein